ncbi:hypothetical protein [Flavobacterium okayamense]|uniref:Uncharacterized protein n=1 Tax=Flavobacterium okayamense TaxID=2830782 RepID=A0ABM7S5M6_9FLAO|nr:hypothetical protein [Flavobacterium okayamense]BCY28700.1 hypothetical protein KK2020170_15680 [Flavobacterium okayamense]
MNKLLLLFILFTFNISAQNSKTNYYLDPEGKEIPKEEKIYLKDKYPDNSLSFRKTKDSGYVYQLNVPKYSTFKVNYEFIKAEIENITDKKYNDSTIYVIEYRFLDDPCSVNHSNFMSKSLIFGRKAFLNQIKRDIEKKYNNTIFLNFFEKKIELKNNKKSKKEYFFSDVNNFFRNNLFLYPTVCGSFCLIKPNGETLVRNGEYRADSMAEHLNPEIWDQVFQSNSE